MSDGCGRPTSRRAMKNQQLSTKGLLSGVLSSLGFIEANKKTSLCLDSEDKYMGQKESRNVHLRVGWRLKVNYFPSLCSHFSN